MTSGWRATRSGLTRGSGGSQRQATTVPTPAARAATQNSDRRLIPGPRDREAAGIAAAGAIVGLVVSVAASRLLASQLFGVQPIDPVTLLGAAALLLCVALAAAMVPAARAARVDPVRTLRGE